MHQAAAPSSLGSKHGGFFLELDAELFTDRILYHLCKCAYVFSGGIAIILEIVRVLLARHRAAHAGTFKADFLDEPPGRHAALARLHAFFLLEHVPDIFRRDGIHEVRACGAYVLNVPLFAFRDRPLIEFRALRRLCRVEFEEKASDDPFGMTLEKTLPV